MTETRLVSSAFIAIILIIAVSDVTRATTCTQSAIIGRWVFTGSGVGCMIDIGAGGTVSCPTGTCALASGESLVKAPSGRLVLDGSCHATGDITYAHCASSDCTPTTFNI